MLIKFSKYTPLPQDNRPLFRPVPTHAQTYPWVESHSRRHTEQASNVLYIHISIYTSLVLNLVVKSQSRIGIVQALATDMRVFTAVPPGLLLRATVTPLYHGHTL